VSAAAGFRGGPPAGDAGAAHAAEAGAGYREREPLVVTALFDSPDEVDRALDALYTAGVPRDLIEVVVSRSAAQRFYNARGPGRRPAREPGRETFRFAGIGALVGFVGGLGFSLLMLMWPGLDAPGGMAPVALFGPNVGTISGAGVGALFGFLRRQRPDPRYARAAEAENAIVLAVRMRGPREAELLGGLVAAQGGRDLRVDVH
jgi:hypothetical protein